MKMSDARRVSVVKRRAVAGACEPVQSLAWEPCPEPRTGAVSRATESITSRGCWRPAVVCSDARGGGMEVIVERPAALDVHTACVMACVRAAGDGRRRVEHVAETETTQQGLLTSSD